MKHALRIAFLALALAGCGDDAQNKAAQKPADCQIGGVAGPFSCKTKSCMDIVWGKEIERSVDEDERTLGAQSAQAAMENGMPGQAATWKGCRTTGAITPANNYQTRDGQYCREYVMTMKILRGPSHLERHGVACRQPGGVWKTVEEN